MDATNTEFEAEDKDFTVILKVEADDYKIYYPDQDSSQLKLDDKKGVRTENETLEIEELCRKESKDEKGHKRKLGNGDMIENIKVEEDESDEYIRNADKLEEEHLNKKLKSLIVKLDWEEYDNDISSNIDLNEEQQSDDENYGITVEADDDESSSENDNNKDMYFEDGKSEDNQEINKCTKCGQTVSERLFKEMEVNSDPGIEQYQFIEYKNTDKKDSNSKSIKLTGSNSFTHSGSLNKHMKVKQFTCSNCNISTSYQRNMKKHVKLRHTDVNSLRNKLDYSTRKKANVKEHNIQRKYFVMKPFTCSECDHSFLYKISLKRHVQRNHPTFYDCEYNLKTHSEIKHSNVKNFACPQCDYSTERKNDFYRHIQGKHSDVKPFKCDECGHCFALDAYLQNHIRVKHSNTKSFTCTWCDFSTRFKHHLKTHEQVKHFHVTSFACNKCDYATRYKYDLKKHKQVKHPDVILFACKECSYSTGDKYNLKQHHIQTKHSIVKPFTCELCDYFTGHDRYLKRHIKYQHPNEKCTEPI